MSEYITNKEIKVEAPSYIKSTLIKLIVLGVELKLITPKLAWQILYPLLIDFKKVCKEFKVKPKEIDGIIFLEDKFSNKIIRKKSWFDGYVYFDKPFSKEVVPEELINLYSSKNFDIFIEIMSNFISELFLMYGFEEISKDFLNFLEKVTKNTKLDKKVLENISKEIKIKVKKEQEKCLNS